MADTIGYPREFLQREDALYLASNDDMLDVLVAQDNGFNNLMLVGHNPGFTNFANYLVPGLTNNLPTAGVVSVQIRRRRLESLRAPGRRTSGARLAETQVRRLSGSTVRCLVRRASALRHVDGESAL